jgi:hypothetical protein
VAPTLLPRKLDKRLAKVVLNPRSRWQIIERGSKRWLAALCTLAVALLPLDAVAQVTEPILPAPPPPIGPQAPPAPGQPILPGQSVTDRPRPEVNPTGLQTGNFFWFPSGEVDEAYNDNIFATRSATSSDLITVLQPRVDLLSSLPQGDALNLHAGAALQYYARHSAQDTMDGFGAVDGRLAVTTGSYFYGGAQIAQSHTPRTSPDSPGNAAEPVIFDSYTANAGFMQTGLRLGYQAEVAVISVKYNAVPLIGGGISPQGSGDVNIYQAVLRGNYEFIPDYQAYIRFSPSLRIFPNSLPGVPSVNSQDYRADLGLQVFPTGLIYGEIYAGYLSQDFRVSSLGAINAPDAGGRVVWNATPLTTLTFNASRTINTTIPSIGNGTGYLDSVAALNVDHELLRNLLLNANVGYEIDEFQGLNRTDNVLSAGAGVRYLLNRNLYLGGTYTYQQRTSSGTAAGTPYTQSILMLRLSTQF